MARISSDCSRSAACTDRRQARPENERFHHGETSHNYQGRCAAEAAVNDKQLNLAPEFQRNSVWPRAAKAYLIDTILHDLPISPLLFQRGGSAQSGRPSYEVIDGQQRLRAVFLYLDNRLRITEPTDSPWHRQRYSDLTPDEQQSILDYDFVVEELSGYSSTQIKDIFTRANKYTVSLSAQELRHAKAEGKFAAFAEEIGAWPFWREYRVFTQAQVARMRNVEFAAELAILLAEGRKTRSPRLTFGTSPIERRSSLLSNFVIG